MSRLFLVSVLVICTTLISCEKHDRQLPVADFTIQPRFGDSLTVFHFDASNSSDTYTDDFRLKVRWDVYSDGIWETGFTILKDFAFKFPVNDTYSITCELKDNLNNVSTLTKYIQVAPVPRDSIFTDARDGQEYKAVFLFDRWWMRENLNFGTELESGFTPSDNSTPEKYKYPYSTDESFYGGYYTWNEATDYGRKLNKGICPEGWRMPNIDDINRIKEILTFTKNYAPYLSEDKQFMLDLSLCGKYFLPEDIWHMQGESGNFWINHKQPFDRFLSWIFYRRNPYLRYSVSYYPVLLTDYQPLDTELVQWQREWDSFDYHKVALPVRCIKDYEIK